MNHVSLSLSRLNRRLRHHFSKDAVLCEYLDDSYFWTGQGIRGKICLETGNSFRIEDDIVLDIACFTELLHNASLIHDDIIDDDTERRGGETFWKKQGCAKALLVGDLLIAKAFEVASSVDCDPKIKTGWVGILADTVSHAVRGATTELSFFVPENECILSAYSKMAADKTGVLFSLPIRCLALVASLDEEQTASLASIFSDLAVAYQIRDDQADFLGDKLGRSHSSDILNGRPNIYHLMSTSETTEESLFSSIESHQKLLIDSAVRTSLSFPYEIQDLVEKLLLPFVRLKPYSPSRLEVPLAG